MGILTHSDYNPTPTTGALHSGVTAKVWTGDLDGVTQYGVAAYPTAAGAVPYLMICRGGTDGSNSSLSKARVEGNAAASPQSNGVDICPTGLAAPPSWDDSAAGGPSGYVVNLPDLREGNGGATESAGSGTDELGGADLEDTAQAWWAALELYSSRMNMGKTGMWGESRGAINALGAMAYKGITPTVCVLRAPLLNIYDWDAMTTATRTSVIAPLDELGFGGASTDTRAELSASDVAMLKKRSPNQYLDLLPTTTKYLVVWGEDDTTIPREWCEAFVAGMRARGAVASMAVIREGVHAITDTLASELTFFTIRRFLASELA